MRWTRSKKANRNFRDARTGTKSRSRTRRSGTSMMPGSGPALGVGGLGIIGLILSLILGVNLMGTPGTHTTQAFEQVGGRTQVTAPTELADTSAEWFNFLLTDVQDFWVEKFRGHNIRYQEATLTLYDSPIRTACGMATVEIGPHYCPLDKGIYLEPGFFSAILERRFGASGDFAQAYVVAHEFGHHVQNELGISTHMREQQARNPRLKNDLSIRLELQADCLAGVWAASAAERGLLDAGDTQEALAAAAAVGDDRIQHAQGHQINPHTWTHGSAEQRVGWFKRGFETADTEQCDTFGR